MFAKIFSSVFRYSIASLLVWYIGTYLNGYLTVLYESFFPSTGGSFDIDLIGAGVFILTLEFLVPFWLVSLGGRFRYWIAACISLIILIPSLLTNSRYVYEDLICIFLGFAGGWLIRKLLVYILQKMPRFEPLKKYF